MAFQIYPYEMAAQIRVTGEDAADFLQSQFSNDLRPFREGQVTYGLWLDVKGKVIADSWVHCEGAEQFRIFSEHCSGRLIAEKLERHIIADDVDLDVLSSAPALALVGNTDSTAGAAVTFRGRRAVRPSLELVFETKAARADYLSGSAEQIVSENWIQHERLRACIPRVPEELGPGDLPGEAQLVPEAVSMTKGCFLGQEVVARLHNLGRPQRGLFLLKGEGGLPEVPVLLYGDAEKRIGELRTAYVSGTGWVGVAMLKIRYAKPGMRVLCGVSEAEIECEFRRKPEND